MKRTIVFAFVSLVVALGFHVGVGAQQVSEGRNLLPVWMPCDLSDPACQSDPRWLDAWKYGDIYLQRQVECSADSSALNPNHLLAACIDYSGIDIGSDPNIPIASNGWTRFTGLLAKLVGRPQPTKLPRAAAAAEAWIRGMWSTNGFTTSTPFFVPGAPWATSALDTSTFYYGSVNATSDPIVVCAPNGDCHIIYMAFNRNATGTIDVNYMVDWRVLDKNIPDESGRHSLASKGPPVMIAGGSNGTYGAFHDKAHALIVPNSSSAAGYDLYVSYTIFSGSNSGNISAFVYVAKSTDGGLSFNAEKVSQSTQQISGSVLVADLNGQVGIFFRAFGSSPTIYFTKRGSSGWPKPVAILGKTYPTLQAFDEVNVKLDATSNPANKAEGNLSPRSNGFPTAAFAQNGTLFVAWQECANPSTGLPLACALGGSPRIMLSQSTDGGSSFSQRIAVDNGIRTSESDGFGFFWNVGRDNNNAHPQIMPTLNCTVPTSGTSGCLLSYWESRTAPLTAGPDPNNPSQTVLAIGGYHRIMDMRGALLNTNGTVAKSFQISRYPYRPHTTLLNADGTTRPETVDDIARVNEVINADGTTSCLGPVGAEPPLPGLDPGCIPRLNFHRNQSGGGIIYFAGDYMALARSTSFVRKADGTSKIPTSVQEVPWVGWHALTTTNQNLLPPRNVLPSNGGVPPTDQLTRYKDWTHGIGGLPACDVGGSRNTDAYMYDINLSLLVTTPVTAKTTPSVGEAPFITFPIQAWNNSGQVKKVKFNIDTLDTGTAQSSFSKNGSLKSGYVDVNPGSSTTRIVYVTYCGSYSAYSQCATPPTTFSPVHVQISEANPDGTTISGTTVGVTFNATGAAQPSASTIQSSISVSDPLSGSPQSGSPQSGSPQSMAAQFISAGSPQSGSPQSGSPQSGSPQSSLTTAWVVEASGDPTAPRSAFVNVDAAFLNDYSFRTRIFQLSSIGACIDANGNATVQYQARQVGNGSPQSGSPQSGSPQSGSPQSIALADGFPNNSTVDNSLFVPKPGKNTQSSGTQAAGTNSTECRIGETGCSAAQPPEREFTVVQLIAEQKTSTPSITYDPVAFPPAITVSSYWCNPQVNDCQAVQIGPDLVTATPVSVSPNPVPAGQQIQFPLNGYSVSNIGNRPAAARRYGFYLSTALNDPILHLGQNGQVDLTQDVLLGSDASFVNPLLPYSDPTTPGTTDSVGQQALTIPINALPGTHYLFFFADDLRKVSETNENNNVVAVPITILPPKYQMIGLFTPCSGLTCGPRNGGSSTPIAFQLSFDGVNAVDSSATKPRLRFYDSSNNLLFSADPDDVSSGGSLWQYFGASCTPVGTTTCSRPAYTWQYNWQTKNPVTGQNLPTGTYYVTVEVPATNQYDGPPNGQGAVARITMLVK